MTDQLAAGPDEWAEWVFYAGHRLAQRPDALPFVELVPYATWRDVAVPLFMPRRPAPPDPK